jgi:NitT/TauT family transport system substrate-binding protein
MALKTRALARSVGLVGVMLSVLAVLGTAGPALAQGPRPVVKIGYLPTDSFAALFLLADRYLPEAGLGAEMVRLAGGPEILSQVVTGQLHVGGAGLGAAVFNAVAGGLPVEVVAPLHQGWVEDYFTVRKAVWGTAVKRIADLRGRPVALNIRGAAVEWMLEQVLRRDGIGIRDVQIRLMPFPDMVPALESGAVDAAILSEPFPTLAEDQGVGVRPLPRPGGGRATPITVVFWNRDWARAHPDLAHRVMLAYLRAARDLALDDGWKQERNIALMLKYTAARAEVLRRARSHVLDPNLELDPGVLESMQTFNAELGYLKYRDLLPASRLFTFTYRDRALAELGRK